MSCRRRNSYRCDLRLRVIGRIARLTGATRRKEHDARVEILRELYAGGKWDVLEALRDSRFSVSEVVGAYRAGRVADLMASLVLEQPLQAAIEAWLPESAPAASTRTRYRVSWLALQRVAGFDAQSAIGDLVNLDWRRVRTQLPGGRHHWKHVRGFVSKFLSDHVDQGTRERVMEAMPKVGKIPGRVPDLTPDAFWRIVAEIPEHVRAAPVAIVATGMRLGEFLGCREEHLLALTKQLRIPGTKTDSSAAVVPIAADLWPWLERAIPCPVGQWRLRELWRDACKRVGVEDVHLHDLRHCYGQWLVNVGIPEEAVQRALRHETASMTRRYTRQKDLRRPAEAIAGVLGCHDPATLPTAGGAQSA